ncbi:MAG TPA: Gldg family protein [Candidatus Scatomonas merdavium]|nr:Gldg family protein [Candidatus Scatomonas merdavium]
MKKISDRLKKEKTGISVSGEERKKNLRHGSYVSIMTVIVIALVAAVNLVVGQLPSSVTQIDASSRQLYTIGEDTENLVRGLEQDVTLYYVVTGGNENEYISRMLERYEDLSDHLTVEKVDPELHPTFTSQYTDEEVSDNSIIVVSGDKSRVVGSSDMLVQELNYYTYSYQVTEFDGEGQVTSAIAYVISDNLPVLYQLTGHDEQSLGSSLTDSIEKNNIEIQDLSLLTEESVPEDAAALLICSPSRDISEEEAQKILSYLEGGGKVLLFTDYSQEEMPNLESLLTNYGLQKGTGIVMEGDSSYYYPQRPDVLIPEINTDSSVLSGLTDDVYALIQDAQPVETLEEYRDTLEIENLLTTTDSGYVKEVSEDGMISFQQEEGDDTGTFAVGVSVTEAIDDETESQLIYFSSSTLTADELDQYVSGGNSEILSCILTNLCEMEDNITFNIPAKSLSVEYLSYTNQSAAIFKVIVIAVIPAAFLLVGFIIWMKRRKQ